MPDEIDRAQDREALFTAAALEERAYQAAHDPVLAPTGYCLFCDAPLVSRRRFCDADCRDAFDHEQKSKRMAGVA